MRKLLVVLTIVAVAVVALAVTRDRGSGLPVEEIVSCQRPEFVAPAPSTERPPAVDVDVELVAEVDTPLALDRWPDGRWVVGQRTGPIVLVDPIDGVATPLIDLTDRIVELNDEGGVLGIAVAPDGDHVYVHHTDEDGTSHIVSWAIAGDGLDLDSERELLAKEHEGKVHNGGHIEFGPDGHLWLGFGDGSIDASDALDSRHLDHLDAKLLRIDPTPDGDEPYVIPADNPFIDRDDARPEVAMTGLRNPWRFSFDDETGDLWIGDVGNSCWEEINRVVAGETGVDFGWPAFEASHLMAGEKYDDPEVPTAFPVLEYDHGPGCAVIGGVVYRGDVLDDLDGWYLYTDTCDPTLRAVRQVADGTETMDLGEIPTTFGFATDDNGEVLLLTVAGVQRLVPA